MAALSLTRSRLAATAAALFGLILSGLLAVSLSAQELPSPDLRDPADGGVLILRGKGVAQELPAVRLGTDIKAKISGTVARVTVTQAFRNTSDKWMEATYLYPLPDKGAYLFFVAHRP